MSDTKQKLLDASIQLMLAKGYTATSVDEICECACVTKGSFFHYFKSKEDIAKGAAEVFLARQCGEFDSAAFRAEKDPLKRVYGRLDLLRQVASDPKMPKSCLIGNFSQELSQTHPEIRCLCDNAFNSFIDDFERDLAEAKKKHAPKAKFDPASVARLCLSLIQGSMILVKATRKNEVFEENIAHFRKYVDQLFA